MKRWEEYEKLIESIYKELAPYAKIERDVRILGRDSKRKRQIDVAMRTDLAGHEILTIVQARVRSRPADVNAVGEFLSVVHDVRAHKGILVCSAGFTESAAEMAKATGEVDLCTAHDLESPNWPLDLRIRILWVETTVEATVDIEFSPLRDSDGEIDVIEDIKSWKIRMEGSDSERTVLQVLMELWNSGKLDRSPHQVHAYELRKAGLRVSIADDFWCACNHLRYSYRLRQKGWLGGMPLPRGKAIANHSTGRLRGKIAISSTDVPCRRDPDWPELPDIESVWRKAKTFIRVDLAMDRPDLFEVVSAEMTKLK